MRRLTALCLHVGGGACDRPHTASALPLHRPCTASAPQAAADARSRRGDPRGPTAGHAGGRQPRQAVLSQGGCLDGAQRGPLDAARHALHRQQGGVLLLCVGAAGSGRVSAAIHCHACQCSPQAPRHPRSARVAGVSKSPSWGGFSTRACLRFSLSRPRVSSFMGRLGPDLLSQS
eukprot:scaffold32543_cov59-Phaeocystis_antarctica.AAC.2